MEAAVGLDEEVVANMDEVVAGMNEEVVAGMDDEVVNADASRDMFEESVYVEPYRLSQVGAGVATQTALALSISEASFNEHLYKHTHPSHL